MRSYDCRQPWWNSANHVSNETNNRYWYAFMMSADDNDWGTGTFNEKEAAEWLLNKRAKDDDDCYIAVIDKSRDALCVEEIR